MALWHCNTISQFIVSWHFILNIITNYGIITFHFKHQHNLLHYAILFETVSQFIASWHFNLNIITIYGIMAFVSWHIIQVSWHIMPHFKFAQNDNYMKMMIMDAMNCECIAFDLLYVLFVCVTLRMICVVCLRYIAYFD